MRRLLALVSLAVLAAGADMAPIVKQGGPFLVPVRAPHVNIASEELSIRMQRERSYISADFRLHNTGSAQTIQVAFPQVTTTIGRAKKGPGIWGAGVWVDEQPLKPQSFHGRLDKQDERYLYFESAPKKWLKLPVELGGSYRTDSNLSWLTWSFAMDAGQDRRVRAEYNLENHRAYSKLAHESTGLEYLLKTASLWGGGRLGNLRIRVELANDYSLHLLEGRAPDWGRGYLSAARDGTICYERLDVSSLEPPGHYIPEEGRLAWDLTDWTPANFKLQAYSYFGIRCSSVLEKSLAYGPQRLIDGDPATAWVPARATGEWVQVPLCLPEAYRINFEALPMRGAPYTRGFHERAIKGLRIFSGYGKSEELFRANNRPRRLRLILCTQGFYGPAGKGPTCDVQLEDRFGWQEVALPPALRQKGVWDCPGSADLLPTYLLHVKVLEVYPGSRYNDTCLSEVEPILE